MVQMGKQKTPRGEELLIPNHSSNLVEARECIRGGNAEPLGRYLGDDLPAILNLLADRLDSPQGPDGGRQQPLSSTDGSGQTQTFDDEEEWVSDTVAVKQCILAGSMVPVAWFLRDLSDLARLLGSAMSPHGDPEAMELRFGRRRRGKPREDPMQQMLKESAIQNAVRSRPRTQKLESVVQEVMEKTGKSRASVFRALPKTSRKRNK
jgi:hypothetical protein